MEGRRSSESEGADSKVGKSDSLISISLNPASVPQTIVTLADRLKSPKNIIGKEWGSNLDVLIKKLKDKPSDFNFIEYKVYLGSIDKYYNEDQSATEDQRIAAKKLKSLFLCFGFYVACEYLLNFVGSKLEEEGWPLNLKPGLATYAFRIVHEFQREFNSNNFDPEVLLEKIEILWRVKKAILLLQANSSKKQKNLDRLGLLAERSNSKSCWWFFLGLVFLAAGVALVFATNGVAIPYLTGLAELSVTGKTAVLAAGIITSGAGLHVMWWQQKRYPTAFCCFWHRMKEMRTGDEQTLPQARQIRKD